MIDLHSHTTASDGSRTPTQLVELAREEGLEALAIADHDTFEGYEDAAPVALDVGLDLICAIELSVRAQWSGASRPRSVHMLGYFLAAPPREGFRHWLESVQLARRERNGRLAARLRELGAEIHVWEAERIGRTMTGRAHFARLLVEKGYVATRQEAFDRYLGEKGSAYTAREGPGVEEGIARIREAGGMPAVAHPVRIGVDSPEAEKAAIERMVSHGLQGIEVWHSDHRREDEVRFLALAQRYGLVPTGGSDYHGDAKPGIRLGIGAGNLSVPKEVLERMRASAGA